ncbi:glycerol kinase 5 isoform X2 [Parasteatoda tepidariorum]|uniref:glycerol kinase 5 isoform X2 n=1 Tax=Parasteatoda tepidariorum TaxID=114398 RepID=UPI0039BD403D
MVVTKSSGRNVILGVDIGTTNIKCFAYNSSMEVIAKAKAVLPVCNLKNGGQEIVPDELWKNFKNVVKQCLLSSKLSSSDVLSLGISTQRGTFVTWDSLFMFFIRNSGETFHNFITWKDKRAKSVCELWNASPCIKFLRLGAFIMYIFTRMKKFQLLSRLQFSTAMVLIRLYWIFQNTIQLQNKESHKNVLFGTIETWLVWKLTEKQVHTTDASNACATGFFDPFRMKWAKWLLNIFGIPTMILPTVLNTCDSFGEASEEIFGFPIPIHALVGDQQASLFGAGCFKKYDMTCTMGTGSFLTMNTGNSPFGAYSGFYPLVGWTISSETTYIIEGGVHDVGTVLSWASNIGLVDIPENSDKIALNVPDNGNVYFLPGANVSKHSKGEAFSSSFTGIATHTSKEHLVRSILEALSFQVCELYKIVQSKYEICRDSLFCVAGGVAKNDFIVQLASNVTERKISRLNNTESSSCGAALLAGLYSGVWKNQDEIKQLVTKSTIFSPDSNLKLRAKEEFATWKNSYSHSIINRQV